MIVFEVEEVAMSYNRKNLAVLDIDERKNLRVISLEEATLGYQHLIVDERAGLWQREYDHHRTHPIQIGSSFHMRDTHRWGPVMVFDRTSTGQLNLMVFAAVRASQPQGCIIGDD